VIRVWLGAESNRRFKFHKCRQLFIGSHNETLSVAAMRVSNEDRSPARIPSARQSSSLSCYCHKTDASKNEKMNAADFNGLIEHEKGHFYECERCSEILNTAVSEGILTFICMKSGLAKIIAAPI
jgi:hypothetical protein